MTKEVPSYFNIFECGRNILDKLDVTYQRASRPNVNRIEARYKIRDLIRKRQPEWKGALKATRRMGKGLHKVFSTVVEEISQELTPLGESGPEVCHFIT